MDVTVRDLSATAMIWDLVVNFVPLILMADLFLFLFRQARAARDMLVLASKAKFLSKASKTQSLMTWWYARSQAGTARNQDFLKHPDKYSNLGPEYHGALLVGLWYREDLTGPCGGWWPVLLSIAGSEFMEMLLGWEPPVPEIS